MEEEEPAKERDGTQRRRRKLGESKVGEAERGRDC